MQARQGIPNGSKHRGGAFDLMTNVIHQKPANEAQVGLAIVIKTRAIYPSG